MIVERKTSEEVARSFHEAYERLAPAYGYETRRVSAVAWSDVPRENRELMIAVVEELLHRDVVEVSRLDGRVRYTP